jgi:anti-anti-sigma factor
MIMLQVRLTEHPMVEVIRTVTTEAPPAGDVHGGSLTGAVRAAVHDGEVDDMPGELVLRPRGEIDLTVADQLRAEWYAALDDARPERVIVDLGEVSFMDSQGLSLLAGLAKRQQGRDGSVAVRNVPAQIHRVMELTRLTEAVPVLPPDHEEASSQ